MRLKLPLVLLFACAVLPLTALDALACSCGAKPNVLAAYERAGVVVSGRLVSVEKAPPDEKETPYVEGIRSATLLVEKVYKGNVRVRDELKLGQGNGGDCLWTFSDGIVGKQFLFYMPRTPELDFWVASACSRSNYLEGATEDLLYLDNINKLQGKTRVSGRYGYGRQPGFELANRKIVIRSEKKIYETTTDENGVFEIYDLLPGKYVLEPEIEQGWKISNYQEWNSEVSGQPSPRTVAFTLEPHKHVNIDLRLLPDNAVEGTIVGPEGNPLAHICATLLRSDDKKITMGIPGCSDKNGKFRVSNVLAGSYYLVVNIDDTITVNEPYRRLFYPNVTQIEKAALITIGNGEIVTGINLMIPKLEDTITISGVLQFSDGKPVSDDEATIDFKALPREGFNANVIESADDNGRFTLKILKGLKGELYAVFPAQVGDYADCPKLDALLIMEGHGAANLKSSAITIEGDRNVENVVLQFPFPKCKLKEIDPG